MANGWTPERRARQAELIRSWQPWENSTGPVTKEGKAKVASNAWKGGIRPKLRELSGLMRDMEQQRKKSALIDTWLSIWQHWVLMVTILLWSTVAHADLNRDNAVNDPIFFATGNQHPQNRSCHRAFLPARTASVVSESEQ